MAADLELGHDRESHADVADLSVDGAPVASLDEQDRALGGEQPANMIDTDVPAMGLCVDDCYPLGPIARWLGSTIS
jgi:hypothetical protein